MKTRFVFLFTLLSFFANSQTKNELSVGIGPSFFGWGDVTGVALTASYAYNFNDYLGFEPRIISSSGWRQENISYNSGEYYTYGYNYDNTGYFAFAGSLVFIPFKTKGDFLKLKSGVLAGKMAHSYGGKRFGAYPMEYSDFGKTVNYGLIHTINFRLVEKENFFFGSELSMLTSFYKGYYNCDGFILNFMGGVKL